MRNLFAAALIALSGGLAAAPAEAYRIETAAEGLAYPWSLAFLPEGGSLVTERGGTLRRVSASGEVSAPLAGVPPVYVAGQGGLLDVVLAPDFAESRRLFLTYAYGDAEGSGTALLRARLGEAGLEEAETIFRATPRRGGNHYGARMAFLPDGTLLLTIGDGFEFRERAQLKTDHLGTILRLTQEGAAPPDNPFVGEAGAAPEIWSYGHRNPQAILFDPASGRVWSHEHGPRGGDELNLVEPGRNYGWPIVTDGRDYPGARISPFGLDRGAEFGFAAPAHVWTPSIAPAGMALYEGEAFPDWRGDLFVAALAGKAVHRLDLEGGAPVGEEVLFKELDARIRDVRTGPDGFLYLLTDAPDGKLLRVRP